MKLGVIIPAAGQSHRFGDRDKLAEDLGGRPLLLRTVEFFTKREDVTEIIVAGDSQDFESFQERFGPALSFHGVKLIEGGTTDRWESVQKALHEMSTEVDRILVHDAARPALDNKLFDQLLLASKDHSAVAPAIPLQGTVKRTHEKVIIVGDEDAIADAILGDSTQSKVSLFEVKETIDRSSLWELQTPQIFDPLLIRKAYEQSDLHGCTDDAQVIEKLKEPVYLIEGDSRNIKVTTQQDFKLLQAILGVRTDRERPAHKRF